LSSSDSNPVDPWARHYLEAARRRRARGWHRREEPKGRGRNSRLKIYLGAVALFVALTIVTLLLPR
jgi:hypothetical protein